MNEGLDKPYISLYSVNHGLFVGWRESEHVAKHAVSPEEAEYVVGNAENPFPQTIEDDKFVVWGTTESGRHLQVIAMPVKKTTRTDENDFDALDRLARGITPEKLRPLTAKQQAHWEAAKRGRPKKAPGAKAVPTLITVEPKLLRLADAYAKKVGVSRSQLFSDAVRRRIELTE